MTELFKEWNPSAKSKRILEWISSVLEDYEQQGYKLTLRQLYYQLVSRDIIPNTVESYNSIGNIVSRGRLAGMIDWDMIEDRMRNPEKRQTWESPEQIVRAAAASYHSDWWIPQYNYIEVWCEKDAVSNILQPVCNKWDVTFMANRGYSSQSAMYASATRFKEQYPEEDKYLFYLGDHDPSGLDMIRDVADRLAMFGADDVAVKPIALNMAQIQKYDPPENPAKTTDSRYKEYANRYGTKSWELDALEPRVLARIVEDAITPLVDMFEWEGCRRMEEQSKGDIECLTEFLPNEDYDDNINGEDDDD